MKNTGTAFGFCSISCLVCPSIESRLGSWPRMDAYRKMADTFNSIGEIAKRAGIRFAYHNHAYSFRAIGGEIPQKILMDHTDPELVSYQMDIYWVVAAGQDPEEWIKTYPSRFLSSHVKDGIFRYDGYAGVKREDVDAGAARDNHVDMESVILGTGTIDYPGILKLARQNGVKYFIVEQEEFTGTTPMDAVKANGVYMKNFRM